MECIQSCLRQHPFGDRRCRGVFRHNRGIDREVVRTARRVPWRPIVTRVGGRCGRSDAREECLYLQVRPHFRTGDEGAFRERRLVRWGHVSPLALAGREDDLDGIPRRCIPGTVAVTPGQDAELDQVSRFQRPDDGGVRIGSGPDRKRGVAEVGPGCRIGGAVADGLADAVAPGLVSKVLGNAVGMSHGQCAYCNLVRHAVLRSGVGPGGKGNDLVDVARSQTDPKPVLAGFSVHQATVEPGEGVAEPAMQVSKSGPHL